MTTYLLTLALTVVVETALACLLAPQARRRLYIDAPLLNVTTQPLATLAIASLRAPFVPVEGLVIVAEVLGYRYVTGLSLSRATLVSCVANAVTATLGLVLGGLL